MSDLAITARAYQEREDRFETILAAAGGRFHALMWGGDTGRYGSPSEADFALAVMLARGFGWEDPDQIKALLEESELKREKWARNKGYLDRTVQNALAVARGQGRYRRVTEADAEAARDPAPVKARTLDDLKRDPDALQPPAAVIPRLAWRGRLTVYSAPDKAGKSTLVAAGVARLTTGQPFLGQPVPPGAALWVMLEEHPNELVCRASLFGTVGDRLAVFELRPGLEDLRREVHDRRADVIVIDPLIRWAGERITESSRAEQWRPIMDELRQLARDLNVAVLVLHHARKSDGETRDSTEITANADVILVQKHRHADTLQRIEVRGRLPSHLLADFDVRLVDGTRYELDEGTVPDSGTERTIWTWLRDHPDASGNAVATAIKGQRQRTLATLKAMEGKQLVTNVGTEHRPRWRAVGDQYF